MAEFNTKGFDNNGLNLSLDLNFGELTATTKNSQTSLFSGSLDLFGEVLESANTVGSLSLQEFESLHESGPSISLEELESSFFEKKISVLENDPLEKLGTIFTDEKQNISSQENPSPQSNENSSNSSKTNLKEENFLSAQEAIQTNNEKSGLQIVSKKVSILSKNELKQIEKNIKMTTNKTNKADKIIEKLRTEENVFALLLEEILTDKTVDKKVETEGKEYKIVPKRLEDLNANEQHHFQERQQKGTAAVGILKEGKLKSYAKEGSKFNEQVKKDGKVKFDIPEDLENVLNGDTLEEWEINELDEKAAEELSKALPDIIDERRDFLSQKIISEEKDIEKSIDRSLFSEEKLYNGIKLRFALDTDTKTTEILLAIVFEDILSEKSSEAIQRSQEKIEEQSKEAEEAREYIRQNRKAFDQQSEKLKSDLRAAKNLQDQSQRSNIGVRIQIQNIEKSILQDRTKLNIYFKAFAEQIEEWAKEIIDSVDSPTL